MMSFENFTSLQHRCSRIDWLLLDVDGVLTDGSIVYAGEEVEVKAFHVRDGFGLKVWQREGKQAGIITGRSSQVVQVRAGELGLNPVIQGASDKGTAYEEVLKNHQIAPEKVCYIGDDLPDLPILLNCGLAVTVPDACAEAIECADYVTKTCGGRGAVRETVELILRCQGRWRAVVEQYRITHATRGPARVDT